MNMNKPLKVYFAGPLFTQAEWKWNELVAGGLRKLGYGVILPQEGAAAMLRGERPFNAKVLFDGNVAAIEGADVVLAVLDQADADSGTSWECGYAYRLGRPIIGIRTDIRRLADAGGPSVNLMLSESSSELVEVPFERVGDVPWVVEAILAALDRLQAPSR